VLGLFFSAGPTSAGQSNSLLRPLAIAPRRVLPSPLDGLFIQTRDLGEQPISTATYALGLHRHLPATLLFIQPTKPQIHLSMQLLIRMRRFLLAMGARAVMHLCSWHSLFPPSLVLL
jgi:hypothetical protein